MTLDEMIVAYIHLRDKKAEVAKRHREEIAPYNEAMDAIEGEVKRVIKGQNLQSLASDSGTAFLVVKGKATNADRDLFRRYVLANSDFELVDFEPRKEAVEAFIEGNNGHTPPGINYSTFEDVQIRRK